MDFDRRRLLLFGTATAMTVAGTPILAADMETSLLLEAQAVDAPDKSADPASPLSYRKPPDTPVLRVSQGGRVRVRLSNRLSEATAIDWHGLRAAKARDTIPGVMGAALAPGQDLGLDITPPESGTFWFHPPFMPGWSDQTARGLAGVLIVEEPVPPVVDDDVVLFLADRRSPALPTPAEALSVNGRPWPFTRAYQPGSRIRLRLVNGSTRMAVSASFEGARAMVIAIDGQPSELFAPLNDTLPVGPGARFDLLVDLPRLAGQDFRLVLRDVAGQASPTPLFMARQDGAVKGAYPPIVALDPNPALPRAIPLEKATRTNIAVRQIAGPKPDMMMFAINGSSTLLLPKAPLFSARRNTAVTVGVANLTAGLIGFRLHGQAVRQLHALDDGWEPYWRDSILVPPGKTVHAAFWADNPGRWLIDSPFFLQATAGLRHWFEIT